MRGVRPAWLLAALVAAVPAAAQVRRCDDEVGAAEPRRLVQQCTQVSPATHPPCNSANPCAMITAEIRRGCEMAGSAEAPAFCRNYRGAQPASPDSRR